MEFISIYFRYFVDRVMRIVCINSIFLSRSYSFSKNFYISRMRLHYCCTICVVFVVGNSWVRVWDCHRPQEIRKKRREQSRTGSEAKKCGMWLVNAEKKKDSMMNHRYVTDHLTIGFTVIWTELETEHLRPENELMAKTKTKTKQRFYFYIFAKDIFFLFFFFLNFSNTK